ncbi:hypothetical protein OIA45_19315 [Streptomyces chartreusis]|uniref:hypothetical protein n=1 Tax=Streptomyces chartreusis TaxID=1969 RepID=UPI00386CFF74|nr:hypothetical protein OIA45_19315 [Streptomyces chartreusis]
MNSDALRWLQAQLGPDTNTADLTGRYERLGSARAVALEVLHERIAALVAEPLKVTVNGVATIDNSANLAALERQVSHLREATAPDDLPLADHNLLMTVQLCSRPRR